MLLLILKHLVVNHYLKSIEIDHLDMVVNFVLLYCSYCLKRGCTCHQHILLVEHLTVD